MSLKRVDQILMLLYPEWTRSKIQSLIAQEKVKIKNPQGLWKTLNKTGIKLDSESLCREDFIIEDSEELHYVSRGALKLKAAIETFNLIVLDKVCLDVGLSTGGFSDYLLQQGAKKILGIDVGHDQLHKSLKNNPRLLAFDKINIRNGLPGELLSLFFESSPHFFDLIVVDVSFISLTYVISPLAKLISPSGSLVLLVKPQFELTQKHLNKKGVVKDQSLQAEIIKKIDGVLGENKLKRIDLCPSPIEGENGNKEILMLVQPELHSSDLLRES